MTATQSIWATVWNPILNNYLDVELRWKNTSRSVWSEEGFSFEDVAQDMLADQDGLTNVKCFERSELSHLMHHVGVCSCFDLCVCVRMLQEWEIFIVLLCVGDNKILINSSIYW